MRKKIILQVDKLVQRQTQKQKIDPPAKVHPYKKHSFDQMYRQAKKKLNRNSSINSPSQFGNHHSTPNSFQNFYQSLRGSRNTPNNTHRHQQEDYREKLNRSLETKANNNEKSSPAKRSTSSERKNIFDRNKKSTHHPQGKINQGHPRLDHSNQISEWQGLYQFQFQWKQVISRLDHSHHEHLRQTECFLSLAEVFHILKSMHYIRKVQDERLLLNLWRELEGETYGGVPSNNLLQFLTIINYCPSNICYQDEKSQSHKRIVIDGNLKLVMSEAAKLQTYQEYLTLRVNHILYGSAISPTQPTQLQVVEQEKIIKSNGNIKIEEEQNNTKKKILLGPTKRAFEKTCKPQLLRQKRSQQITRISQSQDKQHNQDTICYSQFSQSKQSGKVLTSNESQNSISNTQLIEQVVIKRPILSVDVNLGEGLCEKLTVFEGETALQVSKRLVEKYNIDESLRAKFETMLSGHIRNLLYRIDQVSEEMFSDREE